MMLERTAGTVYELRLVMLSANARRRARTQLAVSCMGDPHPSGTPVMAVMAVMVIPMG